MGSHMNGGQGFPPHQQPSSFPSQSFPSSQQPPDFFNQGQQFMNNMPNQEVLNMGLSAGTKIINDKMTQYIPGANRFWHSLKEYFAV